MDWLKKLKEYAPSIAGVILSGGATLPQLAMKAISEATGFEIENETDLALAVERATPEMMRKMRQADNSFKIRMRELDGEILDSELGDIQNARNTHKDSKMPAIICCALTASMVVFTATMIFITIPEENTRMIDTLFGAFITAWIGSINYFVGASRTVPVTNSRKS